jgi:hypothetical protein
MRGEEGEVFRTRSKAVGGGRRGSCPVADGGSLKGMVDLGMALMDPILKESEGAEERAGYGKF